MWCDDTITNPTVICIYLSVCVWGLLSISKCSPIIINYVVENITSPWKLPWLSLKHRWTFVNSSEKLCLLVWNELLGVNLFERVNSLCGFNLIFSQNICNNHLYKLVLLFILIITMYTHASWHENMDFTYRCDTECCRMMFQSDWIKMIIWCPLHKLISLVMWLFLCFQMEKIDENAFRPLLWYCKKNKVWCLEKALSVLKN